jgi:hypothetical protein
MPGKCVIVQCVAILLVSACAPSRDAGLLPGKAQRPVRFGAEFYRNITGAVWYRDSNGDLRSIRNGWTGHQQARGDEITSEEKGGSKTWHTLRPRPRSPYLNQRQLGQLRQTHLRR